MAALASVDDVADLLGLSSEGVDADQAAAMLSQASAKFRSEAQCEFEPTEETIVLRVLGGQIDLPRRPVVSVESVKLPNLYGTAWTIQGVWSWDGISVVTLADPTVVLNATYCSAETAQVTYTHGFTDVPEDVRWSVAQMVARAISSPSAPGIASESIGAYSYSTGAYTASGAASMTREEQAVAQRYRPKRAYLSAVIR